MIDSLGLPGNEPMWIFQNGWCRPPGEARSLPFGWGGLPGSHGGRFIGQISKKHKENEGVSRKRQQNGWWREKRSAAHVFIGPKIFAASPRRRALRSGEECLRSGIETFAATYPKVGKGLHNGVGCYQRAIP